jgi:hypothetical protein
VTVQALTGESIVAPSRATGTTTAVIWTSAALAAAVVVARGTRRLRTTGPPVVQD